MDQKIIVAGGSWLFLTAQRTYPSTAARIMPRIFDYSYVAIISKLILDLELFLYVYSAKYLIYLIVVFSSSKLYHNSEANHALNMDAFAFNIQN